jgi:hypothetical protein
LPLLGLLEFSLEKTTLRGSRDSSSGHSDLLENNSALD